MNKKMFATFGIESYGSVPFECDGEGDYRDEFPESGDAYTEKHPAESTSYSEKNPLAGSAYAEKYPNKGTAYSEEHSAAGSAYSEKYPTPVKNI